MKLKVLFCIGVLLVTALGFAWVSYAGVLPLGDRVESARDRVEVRLMGELQAKGLAYRKPIFMRIFKEEAELELWVQKADDTFGLFKTYPICTFSGELGPKLKEGDKQAPEGFYFVNAGRLNPKSRFHLSFNLGYPNAYDRAHGRTGSALMVHGNCVSIGCYAMTDPLIEEIYLLADAALNAGQDYFRVHVFPFRFTEANKLKYADHQWSDFWANLEEGYRWFELASIPPNVQVANKRYVFDGD